MDITVLTLLRISGFALIDEVEIAFGPGLTAITGETGAGKSILVEALGLLRGGRAGADLIRTGRDEARVEAIVELPRGIGGAARGCSPTGATYDDGLVVRRTIARGGRGRARTWAAAWRRRPIWRRWSGRWSTSPRSTISSR